MFQNGDLISIDFDRDENLSELQLSLDLLLNVYLLRCPNDYEKECTSPGGVVTDFNMWGSEALTVEDMKSWTTCEYVN